MFLYKMPAVALVAALCFVRVEAKSETAWTLPRPKPDSAATSVHDYLPDILAAQSALAQVRAGYTSMDDFNWLLAVEKKGGGPITIVPMERDFTNSAGFVITSPVDNGVNTRFTVVAPEGYVVLAEKRVVRTRSGLGEVVYTAYDPAFDTPALRAQGLRYLETLRADAYGKLAASQTPSLAFPGKTVADVVPKGVAVVLAITEHIDPARVRHVGLAECIDEVLVTIAANRERAYAYSLSSAGARGLFQFIPETYALVREQYPAGALMPDFIDGMSDHENAARASLLLFDLEFAGLPSDERAWIVERGNERSAAEYLAAAYNWNATRAARAYAKSKRRWMRRLPAQTQTYVAIQRKVALLIGG